MADAIELELIFQLSLIAAATLLLLAMGLYAIYAHLKERRENKEKRKKKGDKKNEH